MSRPLCNFLLHSTYCSQESLFPADANELKKIDLRSHPALNAGDAGAGTRRLKGRGRRRARAAADGGKNEQAPRPGVVLSPPGVGHGTGG